MITDNKIIKNTEYNDTQQIGVKNIYENEILYLFICHDASKPNV